VFHRHGPLIEVVGVETRVEWEADNSTKFLLCLSKPDWLLLFCRAKITNQALVDREGSLNYYLRLSLHACHYLHHLNQRSRSPCRWYQAPLCIQKHKAVRELVNHNWELHSLLWLVNSSTAYVLECGLMDWYAWYTMSSSSMDEAVRVRNWPITVECMKNSWLWLVNFLLLQPHPYCYCSL